MTDALRLRVRSDGTTMVLRPEGELDVNTAAQLRVWVDDYLTGDSRPATLVDLSGLTFIDSPGLAALLAMRRRLADGDAVVVYADPTPQPARLLRITGLAARLPVFGTLDEALRSLAAR
ncbi:MULTISPECIES: STAS domain-containing protein [Streptosporangium]|uniref:Anti-sigma factor antagonist n=1 Tax=Streptosporangium brasiliense TaxID=47480 RepID=A0ABT9RDV7_9ACTN|nr:STAS domain-containing protein [Streptosporangium brasiliense]MDP9866585.1 anti-anti-sigma factor [Streptosporangium brasiliense]